MPRVLPMRQVRYPLSVYTCHYYSFYEFKWFLLGSSSTIIWVIKNAGASIGYQPIDNTHWWNYYSIV